jgi:ribosomal protein S18 acetylase RimI-like enzyme
MSSASAPAPIRLTPADAARYLRLRDRMLRDAPWAFDASPVDGDALDLARTAATLASAHAATFAVEAPAGADAGDADDAAELVAAATITRALSPKFAHRARISGVFVHPAHRGGGLGRAVMAAAIGCARGWQGVDFVDLGVSENSPAALRLYESLGFRAWGREPEATALDGRRYDEIYMTLRL